MTGPPKRPRKPAHPAAPPSAPRRSRVGATTPGRQSATPNAERLQKVLAAAGVASRRASEEMIAAGRVSVNGQVVTEMGHRVVRGKDRIEVDGKAIATASPSEAAESLVYIALNKPEGVVSTSKDTHARSTVLDLLKGAKLAERGARVYPVGRLDAESTGLLLLTNDGELTFRLTHPRYGIEKEYRALVRGRPGEPALQKLREGVEVEGEKTAPARVDETGRQGGDTWLRVVIHEGRKRQVRLMCAAVGHPVLQLQRVRFGPIALGDLEPGRWRFLAAHEVHALRKAVKLKLTAGEPAPPASRRPGQHNPRRSEERTHGQRPASRQGRAPAATKTRGATERPGRPAAPKHRDRRPGGRG